MPKRIGTKILVVFYIIYAFPFVGYMLLYFQSFGQNDLTNQIIEQQQPTSLSWVRMMNGINHSQAELRGWILFGGDSFKLGRAASWAEEIEPMLDQPIPTRRDRNSTVYLFDSMECVGFAVRGKGTLIR